jgi:hypothetical protein
VVLFAPAFQRCLHFSLHSCVSDPLLLLTVDGEEACGAPGRNTVPETRYGQAHAWCRRIFSSLKPAVAQRACISEAHSGADVS